MRQAPAYEMSVLSFLPVGTADEVGTDVLGALVCHYHHICPSDLRSWSPARSAWYLHCKLQLPMRDLIRLCQLNEERAWKDLRDELAWLDLYWVVRPYAKVD